MLEEERKKLLDVFLKQREEEKLERERLERERKERERIERERKEREKEEKEKQKLLEELNDKYNIIKDDLPVPFRLDITKYEKLYKSKNNKCMICLEVYKVGNQVLYLPCSHLFHSVCIMRWLLNNNKCLICTKDYRDKQDEDNNSDLNNNLSNEHYYDNRNWRGSRRGGGRGGRGNWRGGRGNWRGGRGNWRGGRGNWRGGRGNWRGRGIFRGQRGRGGNYYSNF